MNILTDYKDPKAIVPENKDIIYVDHSTISTFRLCQEKARLNYVLHLRPNKPSHPLSFGHAFHAAIQEYYGEGFSVEKALSAFIKDCQDNDAQLPINIENDEKRSIERGLGLVNAYISKWSESEHYDIISKEYIEVGFAVYLMDWNSRPVMYVGRIDRIMKSRLSGKPYIFELKTTGGGLSQFTKQVRPNHQITGYQWACKQTMGLEPVATIWDSVFISDRKPDLKKGSWFSYGIDIEKDFSRVETRRSPVDIDEFLFDLKGSVREYLKLKDARVSPESDWWARDRWIRSAPTSCFMYGGCMYLDICSMNLNEAIIRSNYHEEPWRPWIGITEDAKI